MIFGVFLFGFRADVFYRGILGGEYIGAIHAPEIHPLSMGHFERERIEISIFKVPTAVKE